MSRTARNHEQYFTQAGIAELCVRLLPDIRPRYVIDPAAGKCAFLDAARGRWRDSTLFGIDIDEGVLPPASSKRILLVGDSLLRDTYEASELGRVRAAGWFDLVAGNPPFSGKTDKVHDVDVLRDYELALLPDGSLRRGVAKEELFLERFVRLAKPGGWIVVVLPRGLLCNPRSRYVREYVVRTCRVAKVLDLPAGVFDGTRASASVLLCQKRTEANVSPPPNETTSLFEARRSGDRYCARAVARAETGMLVRRMDSGYHSADAANLRAGLLRLPGARCLGDITNDIVQGYTKYGRRRRFVQKGGVRYLESRVISPVGILEKPRLYVSPRGRMVRASAFVQPADLLVVRVGSACLGRATIVCPRDRGSAINDCIWRLRVDAPAGFIALFLSSKTGRSLVNAAAQQSGGATTLSREFLLEMPVPYVASPTAVAYAEEYERNVLGAGNSDKRTGLTELTLRLDLQIARDLRRR